MKKWKLIERTQATRAETFRQFILFSGALGFTLALGLSGIWRVSLPDLVEFLRAFGTMELEPVRYAQAVVYVTLFCFGLSWGLNGLHELALLQEWLKPGYYFMKRRNLVHFTCILVGIFLGLVFAVTPNFLVLAWFFSGYTLVDLYLWKLRRDEIAALISSSTQALQRDYSSLMQPLPKEKATLEIFAQGAQTIARYYMERPHYTRVVVQFVVITFLAAASSLPKVVALRYPSASHIDELGYLGFLLCLVAVEIIIYRGRLDMDRRLTGLANRLRALEFDGA